MQLNTPAPGTFERTTNNFRKPYATPVIFNVKMPNNEALTLMVH